MHDTIVFDIETAPLPEDQIVFPEFKAPGNYKDPKKIAEYIAEKRVEFLEKAALNACASRVVAIGTMEIDDDGDDWEFSASMFPNSERTIISSLWDRLASPRTVVTYNGKGFDLPFLFRRSWILRLQPPDWLRDGRYWSRDVIDVFEDWQLGNRETPGSLDVVSRAVLGRGKSGDGAGFWELLQNDREKAKQYLSEDCTLPKDLFLRFRPNFR